MPVVVSLDALNEEALVRILKEPRNSLVKQYQALMDMDGVELEFEEEALQEVAKVAMDRKTGARGLRSVIEKTMNDVMYESPSDKTIQKCIITKEAVKGVKDPKLIHGEVKVSKRRASAKRAGRPETA